MSRRDPVRRRSRLRAALLAASLCADPAHAADPETARALMGLAEDRRRMQDAARLLDRMGAPAGAAPAHPVAAAAPSPPPPPALPSPVVVETPAPIRPPREAQAAVAKPGANPPVAAAVPSAAPPVPQIVPQAAPPPARIDPPARVEPVRPQPPAPVAEPARPDAPKPAPPSPAVVAALPERAPGPVVREPSTIVGRPAQEAAPARLPAETEVYFGYGSATLSDEAVAALLPLGQDRAGTSAITLLGHADALEKDTQDRKLSERRAEAVRRFLVSSLGFDPRRISLRGLGAERPKVKGDLPSPQNRRVEILPAPAGPAALSPPSPGRPSTDRGR